MGKASQRVQAAKRMERAADHVYPPMPGELLMVDRVTNAMLGQSVEYVIRVGRRLNGISVSVWGRAVPSVTTWTKFYDLRRRRCAVASSVTVTTAPRPILTLFFLFYSVTNRKEVSLVSAG